jgi:thiamine biosynthesis lipoprotein
MEGRARSLRPLVLTALGLALLAAPVALLLLREPVPGARPSKRAEAQQGLLTATRYHMGGVPCHLSCGGLDQAAFDRALERLDARVGDLEGRMSDYRPESPISRLNAGPAGAWPLDPETLGVVAFALRISEETGGAFDVTVKPLVRLWKQARVQGAPPPPQDLAEATRHVGWRHLSLLPDGSGLAKDDDGVALDLGAIAKGYIADQALAVLRDAGCTRALAELGGDIAVLRGSGQPLVRIGLVHPRRPGALYGVLQVDSGGTVTSGDYERFVEVGGKRYGHILDPRTGMPVEGLASVTVVGPDAMTADAYATAFFALGWEDALALAGRHPELTVVFLAADGREFVSEGLRGRFERSGGR